MRGKVKRHLPTLFREDAVCWACGKRARVNFFGFCEECWKQYAHLRERK
jgi:hypothetical protein